MAYGLPSVMEASMVCRSIVFLILAIGCGVVGFARYLSHVSPLFPEGMVTGLGKILSIVCFLLFVISLFFGKDLSGRQY